MQFLKYICILGIGLLLPSKSLLAQTVDSKVSMLYIYNMTKYIIWPDNALANNKVVIGVLANQELFDQLSEMAETKKAGAKDFVIKKIGKSDDLSVYSIVVVGGSAQKRTAEIASALSKMPVLVVEQGDNAYQGGDIQFVKDDGKLKMNCNKSSLDKKGFKVSSAFLSLCKII